jgi:Tfp pilus assembly protein PilF/O-antigen ligase
MDIPKRLQFYDQAILYSFYPLIFFLPISTALVELFSTIILSFFFLKQWLLLEIKNKKSYSFPVPFWQRTFMNIAEFFRPPPHPLNGAIAALLFINLLSVIFSPYTFISLKGFVCKLFESVYLYFAFLSIMKTEKQCRWFIFVFLASIFLISLNGMAEHLFGREFIFGRLVAKDGRIVSSFKQANDFGSYLLIASFLTLGFVMEYLPDLFNREKRKAVPLFSYAATVILFFLTLYCLGFTFSRGAWAGFFLGLILLAFLYKRLFLIPVLLAGFFLMIFSPLMQTERNVSFRSDDVRRQEMQMSPQPVEPVKEGSAAPAVKGETDHSWQKLGMGRYMFWKEALHIIEEFPVFGVGINTYSMIAPEYKLTWGGYPHNCYLQMAAETGTIGVLSFFWLLFRLFSHGLGAFWRQKRRFFRAVLGGLLPGLFAFLAHSFVDTNFYSVQLGLLMWMAMAVLVTFSKQQFASSPSVYDLSMGFDFDFFKKIQTPYTTFVKQNKLSKAKILLLIFVAVTVISHVRHSHANSRYSKVYCSLGEENLQKNRPAKAKQYFKRAIELNPQSAKAYLGLGLARKAENKDEKAIEALQKAIELDPAMHPAYNALGLIYQKQGQYRQAMYYFEKAIHAPENYKALGEYRYNLGVNYLLMGDRDRASKEIEYIMNVEDPGNAQKLKVYIESH